MPPSLSSGKRISGRLVVLIILVLLAALGGGATYFLSTDRPVAGSVLALHALDREGAIVIREASHDRKFVELVDAEGKVLWQALVPGYAGTDDLVAIGVAERVLTVRTFGPGGEALTAFADRKNGKVGKILMGASAANAPGHRLTIGRRGLELYRADDQIWRVLGLDLETGESRWEQTLGMGEVRWVAEAGGQAALAFTDRVAILDAGSGKILRSANTSWACPSAAGVVALSAGALVVLAENDDEDLALAADLSRAVGDGACGAGDEALVLAWNTETSAHLAAVDRQSGEVRWQHDAPANERFETPELNQVRRAAPNRASLAARLGAFVVVPWASGDRVRFDVTRIADGEVLTAAEVSRQARLWREPESSRLWLHDTENGALMSIDAAAGVLKTEAMVEAAYPLSAHNLVSGALWFRGIDGYALVNTTTMEVRRAVGKAPTVRVLGALP